MSQIDRREGIEGRAWISGKHEWKDLQVLVFKFIRDTVLCRQCLGPETTVQISGRKKRKTVVLDCGSCGATCDVPQTTKFAKWMALHPPAEAASWGRASAAALTPELLDGGAHEPSAPGPPTGQGNDVERSRGQERGGARGADVSAPDTLDGVRAWKKTEAKRLKASSRAPASPAAPGRRDPRA